MYYSTEIIDCKQKEKMVVLGKNNQLVSKTMLILGLKELHTYDQGQTHVQHWGMNVPSKVF
jgi:hypothetical protein